MDNIASVQMIQNYIKEHLADVDFSVDKLCLEVGYSRRQIDRLFKKYFGKTLSDYINAVLLSKGAEALANTNQSVLDIALNHHFQTHEGFTRSFSKRFHLTPNEYRAKGIAIPLFIQYPISHYHILKENEEALKMSSELKLCMITPKERPGRKLIYLPSKNAKGYLSYCEEKGCEWEGLLGSISEKMDLPALIELPDFLVEEGFSKVAAGVEVPLDYDKPIPEGYKVAELEECIMLYFQTEPYDNPDEFPQAIEGAYEALKKYNPSIYGYEFAYDIAPSFNFGAEPEWGAKIAVPVKTVD